jgi:predicted SnoaL-like aldol condensation-catalyzing enzyme
MRRALALALLLAMQPPAGAQVPVSVAADPEALFTDADPQLHANKQVALRMMRELLQCNHWSDSARWMKEDYIQHNPNLQTGREALARFFSAIRTPSAQCAKLTSAIVAVTAQGDLVTVAWRMVCPEANGAGTYTSTWFNMWRIENGKIAEHWDPAMKAPLTCRIGE